MNPRLIQNYHNAGMSVAAIHYRFIDGEEILLPEPQRDGARAVQFLRSKAKEWNIRQETGCLLWRFCRRGDFDVDWLSR